MRERLGQERLPLSPARVGQRPEEPRAERRVVAGRLASRRRAAAMKAGSSR